MAAGVRSANKTWVNWTEFCFSLDIDPTLSGIEHPVELLQVFALRIRDGRLSKSGKPVRSEMVANSLREVGQTLTLMGSRDPRLDTHGHLDLQITRLQKAFEKQDPAPDRAKPIPVSLLVQAATTAYHSPTSTPTTLAVVNLMCLAFYFLMCPDEYCTTPNEPHPFWLQDVQLFAGRHILPLDTAMAHQLQNATAVHLTFTTHKNSTRGEKISQGISGHRIFCPV